jgi:hypothetical protein
MLPDLILFDSILGWSLIEGMVVVEELYKYLQQWPPQFYKKEFRSRIIKTDHTFGYESRKNQEIGDKRITHLL